MRQRRTVVVIAAVAAAVILVAVAGVRWGWGDRSASVVADPDDFVPATPRALVALADELLDTVPMQAEGLFGEDAPLADLAAHIWFDEDTSLLLTATTIPDNEDVGADDFACGSGERCVDLDVDGAIASLTWDTTQTAEESSDWGEPIAGGMWLTVVQGDELHGAMFESIDITGDPRDLDLEISVDELTALLTDARYGTRTARDLVDRELDYWHGPASAPPEPAPTPEPTDQVDRVVDIVEEYVGAVEVLDGSQESDPAWVNLSVDPGSRVEWGPLAVEVGEGAYELRVCDDDGAPDDAPARSCEPLQSELGELTLFWVLPYPGRDIPGFVGVLLQRPDEYRWISYDADSITSDPRELDLPISVERLVEMASDPRLVPNDS